MANNRREIKTANISLETVATEPALVERKWGLEDTQAVIKIVTIPAVAAVAATDTTPAIEAIPERKVARWAVKSKNEYGKDNLHVYNAAVSAAARVATALIDGDKAAIADAIARACRVPAESIKSYHVNLMRTVSGGLTIADGVPAITHPTMGAIRRVLLVLDRCLTHGVSLPNRHLPKGKGWIAALEEVAQEYAKAEAIIEAANAETAA